MGPRSACDTRLHHVGADRERFYVTAATVRPALMLAQKYDVPGMRGAAENFLDELTTEPTPGHLTW